MKAIAIAAAAAMIPSALIAQAVQIKVEPRAAVWDTPPVWGNGVAMVPIRS